MAKPLTIGEISNTINRDVFGRSNFLGVYAIDQLPRITCFPCCLVVNTDPFYKPGEHWVAIYFEKNRSCEFFDSFGIPPDYYGLNKYIDRVSRSVTYNNIQLQEMNSSSCGYYCIYYILLKSRFFDLKNIIGLFSKTDFKLNDFLVEHVY